MNESTRNRRPSCDPSSERLRLVRLSVLLIVLLVLAACGRGDEEPTPTSEPVTESPLVVAASTASAATQTPSQPDSPLPEVQEPQQPDSQATAGVTATVSSNGTTAVFTPLEVDEGMQCDIESHIDLAGYPNLEQVLGCPTGEGKTDPVAINEFGEGPEYDRFMLWFSDTREIYVLFPDGTWQPFEDTWVEGDPTFSCNPLEGEPDSPPLPRRGFGKLWCSDPYLQETLGTIPREERLCQHSVTQPFADGRLLACFEDATIRYFRLLDDNTWDVVVQ
jgi:hypothetical protein